MRSHIPCRGNVEIMISSFSVSLVLLKDITQSFLNDKIVTHIESRIMMLKLSSVSGEPKQNWYCIRRIPNSLEREVLKRHNVTLCPEVRQAWILTFFD